MKNNKGFSLVELIVVIAIMAILAAVAIPTFATFISRAQVASDVDYMNQVESAVELAYAQKGYEINKITVNYKVENNKELPAQIVVDFTDATDVTITEADKDGTDEKADVANIIDWSYAFNKVDYDSLDDDKVPANWDQEGWSLAPVTP